MGEEATSWVRRTKFSHTIYHRLDSSRLPAISFTNETNRNLRHRPVPLPANFTPTQNSASPVSQMQKNPITNKPRSLSPLPETLLSDAFKEARSTQKRFSTPIPRRKGSEKGSWITKEYHRSKTSDSVSPPSNRKVQLFASMKVNDKSKGRKESTWAKYFDHSGGRVMDVETAESTVDMSKLFLGPKFACGARSRLYHGIYMDKPVAVKIIRVPDDDENGALAATLEKQFTREVTLLSRLQHQNVIRFVAACRNPPVYCIITEYLSVGSLRAYLHKLEHKLIPLPKLLEMAMDIAQGMEYVHSQGVIHRDLKPENVLINEDFHLKIADFGIACDAAYCDTVAEDPGTYRWMAPEMIKRKPYGRKVDVYSFGLILWEMAAGRIPYEDMNLNPIQVAYAVLDKDLRPPVPKGCPGALQALIEQCWSVQPEKRPEFWQIVKVLKEFKTSLASDGTLNLAQVAASSLDDKKDLLRWIHKLGPAHNNTARMPKGKFT